MLCSKPITSATDGHLLVLSLRKLTEGLKPASTLLALDVVWRRLTRGDQRTRQLCVVDEVWLLMQQPRALISSGGRRNPRASTGPG